IGGEGRVCHRGGGAGDRHGLLLSTKRPTGLCFGVLAAFGHASRRRGVFIRITNVIVIAITLSSTMAAMRSAPPASARVTEAPEPGSELARNDAPRAGARMTREQSKAQTRERLLEAARSVFASSGFHGAS